MPIKKPKPEPVTMVPAPDYAHQRLKLDDVAEWVQAARESGVPGDQDIKAVTTMGGYLKTLSGTPEATNG
jgi:hypothetical protein